MPLNKETELNQIKYSYQMIDFENSLQLLNTGRLDKHKLFTLHLKWHMCLFTSLYIFLFLDSQAYLYKE